MPVDPPALDALDPAAVAQNLAETVARINEDNPSLDLRPGVLFSVLAYYHSVLATADQAVLRSYLDARSLLALSQDPLLASPDLVDDVLSNYLVRRKPGAAATGQVVVVVSSDVTTTIGVGATFSANGLGFAADQTYTAKVDQGQINSASDRLLTPTADGNWSFAIGVVAAAVGSAYSVAKDTLVVPDSPPPGYVTSYAASDFSGGADAEANDALLARLQQGVAAKCLANRATSAGLLRDVDAFSGFVALSVVGMGDPEMLRDKHSILPLATGGRVDWYVRTQPTLRRLLLTRTASLVSVDPDGYGRWQLALGRDDAPGFYEVANIRPQGADPATFAGGFAIDSDTRSLDLTGAGFVPDVAGVTEGAYSRFQAAIVSFKDTAQPAAGLPPGARRQYDLEARGLPLIGEIQDYASSRDVRHRAMDCLVRAPVPCFVQLTLSVFKQADEPAPDVASIAQAMCAVVNAVGFVGRLYASNLQDAAHAYLHNATSLSSIDMLGRIRYPSGYTRWVRGREVLRVPDDPANMVGPRTVQFFASPDDVAISVVTAVPSDG